MEQTYCLGAPDYGANGISVSIDGVPLDGLLLPPDAITLRLMVRLSYRNVSANPIIFSADHLEAVVISHSLYDAVHERHQTIVSALGQRGGWVETRLDKVPASPPYEVIPPGASSASPIDLDVRFQVHNPAERRPEMELLGSKVFFQLDLDHSLLSSEAVRVLGTKWRRYGILWAERIRTKPFEIDIPQAPKTAKCPSEFRID
jgi:hypothetical protein